MIRTIINVARSEGLRSVAARALERVRPIRFRSNSPLVNVLTTSARPSLGGGVAVQLLARLAEEQRLRDVSLMRTERNAKKLIVEGAFDDLAWLPDDAEVVFVVHDFTLPRHFVSRAKAIVFPSAFLRDAYGGGGYVIEPGIVESNEDAKGESVAFVGSVKPDKGGALIPEIIRAAEADYHVFGGGDFDLLRAIRGAAIHGYYRAATLPRLLARHHIGLAILPSIVPESFSLTLSECWSAGVPVIAFDHGAIAERIRAHGGGFLVPLEAGAAGIADAVREWQRGALVDVPTHVPTAREAAAAHVALYRRLGLL